MSKKGDYLVDYMKNSRRLGAVVIILFSLAVNCFFCYSQTETEDYKKEFSVISGWMDGNLKQQDDYQMVPLYLQFGFDITPSFNNKPKGRLKFVLEPFLNTIISPDNNMELGNDFILKYSYPVIQKFHVYVEGGAGMMYTSQHTTEQGTQFNFTEHVGGGVSYFFAKNKAVNFGYRYRHFSNCDIKRPNKGVDTEGLLAGISILY